MPPRSRAVFMIGLGLRSRLAAIKRYAPARIRLPSAPTAAASVGVARPKTIEPSTAMIMTANGKNDASSILKISRRCQLISQVISARPARSAANTIQYQIGTGSRAFASALSFASAAGCGHSSALNRWFAQSTSLFRWLLQATGLRRLVFFRSNRAASLYKAGGIDRSSGRGGPEVHHREQRDIARARGMTEIARASGITREALYKALKPDAQPRFDTIARVCTALGLKISVAPA